MRVEKALSLFFKYAGFVMAAVLGLAIILGVLGLKVSITVTQLGIVAALIIPILGLVITMVILFRSNENKYALLAIGLLAVLVLAVFWRLYE